MKRILAIIIKEMQVFFYSPLIYVLWALFFFFNSWAFVQILNVLNDPMGVVQIAPVEIFFGGTIFFWLLMITLTPLLTMRTISEEKRTGSLEQILTAPISEWEFLLGKFLAVNLVLGLFWLSALVYPCLISGQISFHWPAVGVAFVGVVLLNAVFSAVGIFASSLTANQVVSAFLSFVMVMILFTIGIFSRFVVGPGQKVLSYVSVLEQFQNSFSSGILDSRAVVYFVSLSLLFLTLAWLVLVGIRRRRWDTWISFVLILSILGGVNVISFMHWKEWDFSGQEFYHLSDRAKELLKGVNRDVEVFVCLSLDSRPRTWIEHMLREANKSNPKIKFEMIDPARDIVSVRHLFEEFKSDPVGTVLVRSGNRKKIITERDLIEMDYSPVMKGHPPRVAGFNGERALVSAILSVAKEGKEEIFFVSGHGETRIEDVAPGRGLSQLRDILASQGFLVQQDSLLKLAKKTSQLPSLLIFPSPKKALLKEEQDLIGKLLTKGVGVLLLLDPGVDPDLADWLAKGYGIKVGDDVVVDPTMSVMTPVNLVINFFALHPITKPFVGTTMLLFSGACSLDRVKEETTQGEEKREQAKKPQNSTKKDEGQVYKLIFSSPNSWAETDWHSRRFSYDKDKDVKGPVCVGVAWEGKGNRRMVVLGDSNFITNEIIKQLSNEDFLLAVLDWLRSREVKVELGPREIKTIRLSMPIRVVRLLSVFSVLGLPLVPLLVGAILVVFRRKRR